MPAVRGTMADVTTSSGRIGEARTWEGFSPATRAWFSEAFPQGPTPVQTQAWEAIARGRDVLVVAPTGSGKTLAAFLWAIDRLAGGPGEHSQAVAAERSEAETAGTSSGSAAPPSSRSQEKGKGRAPAGPRILYISPMKALGVDVSRNLRSPLAGIARQREARGEPAVDLRVGVRSGDTPSSERGRLLRHPPDILITTPESLYLMETSRAREILRGVDTVIVDEVHAVAGTKRGAHLALGLERLDDLIGRPAQRIGLSATVRPREEVARFLGGARPVEIVAPDAPVRLDIRIVAPVEDMTDLAVRAGAGAAAERDDPQASASIWPHLEAAVLDQVMAHRSTIVFVNSRGLAERLTARLNELHAERLAHPELTGARAPDPDSLVRDSRLGGTTMELARGRSRRADAVERTADAQTSGSVDGGVADIARAHHGSMSKERRELVEHDLKSGELRCVVATSSLELGIDMGAVDLVIQVAAPPSVASGLQRAGRAGHQVGGTSRALVYPRTRRELIDAAVTVERMQDGLIEELRIPANPLDVLAQQTVAAAVAATDGGESGAVPGPSGEGAGPGLDVDAWYTAVRRAASYRDLPRSAYEGVLDMLSGRAPSDALAELRPRLVWDRVAGVLRARPGTRRLAVTSGGTIPDRGAYRVVLPDEEGARGAKRVGELDEEMVYESRVGDVITLGAATWRIQEITTDRVVVVPAPGRPARLAFWHGDGPGRPAELGAAVGAFIRRAEALIGGDGSDGSGAAVRGPIPDEGGRAGTGAARPRAAAQRGLGNGGPADAELDGAGLDGAARRNLRALLEDQRAATGLLPTDQTLVLERCHDEAGDWRLILHSCYGERVNAAWALAVGNRLREQLGLDPQVMAADDGIVLILPDTAGLLPGPEAFRFDPAEIRALVRDGVGQSALFAAHFRECAARALLLPRRNPGQRTPLWQQRQRAGQLLSVASAHPDFPILLETARECLQDVYDLPALSGLMASLEKDEVRIVEAETAVPSPFAQTLLFGYVANHLYDSDTPVAERRSSVLSLDTALLADLLGDADLEEILDADVVARVGRELQRLTPERRVRGAEGVADLLRLLGPLTVEEIGRRLRPDESRRSEDDDAATTDAEAPAAGAGPAERAVRDLARQRRTIRVVVGGRPCWAAVEDAAPLRDALGVTIPDGIPEAFLQERSADPLGDLATRILRTHGPLTTGQVAARLGIGVTLAEGTLERLRAAGTSVRLGNARSDAPAGVGGHRWVSVDVLRVLRLRSLQAARAATKPVSERAYARFLLDWQGVTAPGAGRHEVSGAGRPEVASAGDGDPLEALERALDQLAGAALPASVWESAILPARVPGYRPAMLDHLIASGALLWCGAGRLGTDDGLIAFCPADVAPELLPDPVDGAPTPRADQTAESAPRRADRGRPASVAPPSAAPGSPPAGSVRSDFAPPRSLPSRPEQSGPLAARILGLLSDGGAYFADQIAHLLAPGSSGSPVPPGPEGSEGAGAPSSMEVADALRDLMWAGRVTADSYEPVRAALLGERPARMPRVARRPGRARVRLRPPVPREGRWAAVPRGGAAPTERALAAAEGLAERHGVVARGSVAAEGVPGGFAAVIPVMQALEDTGRVLRGHFVEGLGGTQFARRNAVDRLRAVEAGAREESGAVALSAVDPANPFGAALAWPAVRGGAQPAGAPARRAGAFVVIREGAAVVWMGRGGHAVLTFTDEAAALADAARALAAALAEGGTAPLTVETVDGDPVRTAPFGRALRDAGFAETPRGLRLYR